MCPQKSVKSKMSIELPLVLGHLDAGGEELGRGPEHVVGEVARRVEDGDATGGAGDGDFGVVPPGDARRVPSAEELLALLRRHLQHLWTQVVVAGLLLDGDPDDLLEARHGVHRDGARNVDAGEGAAVGREAHGVGRVRVVVAGSAPREGRPRRREYAGEE